MEVYSRLGVMVYDSFRVFFQGRGLFRARGCSLLRAGGHNPFRVTGCGLFGLRGYSRLGVIQGDLRRAGSGG